MRRTCLLLLIALAACTRPAPTERLVFTHPQGFEPVAYSPWQDGNLTILLPTGQTTESWTEMVRVAARPRPSEMSFDALLAEIDTDGWRACRYKPYQEQRRLTPQRGARNAAMIYWACGKRRRDGRGEVAISVVLEGEDKLFAVFWAWNFPETNYSQGLQPPSGARERAEAVLATAWICAPAAGCAEPGP